MESNYQPLKLEDLLSPSRESIEIDPLQIYKQITIRLNHKGVILREEKSGQLIKSKQYKAKTGQFTISRIDARNGAMGLIPPELDGSIVTNDFLLYNINEQRLYPKYFEYLTSTLQFVNECIKASKGTTNRVRLNPERFLEIEISLPSLDEQKRAVAIIDRMMERINEARWQRMKALEELLTLISRYHILIFDNLSKLFTSKYLESISNIEMGQSPLGTSYNEIGEGVPLLNGPTEFGRIHPIETQWTSSPTKTCNEGDLLICVRGATTGKMNWADKKYCIGRGLAAINPNDQICDNKYLWYFLNIQTEIILSQTRGSTFPNLPSKQLKQLEAPIPPLNIQHQIVAHLDFLQAKVEELKKLQAETESDIKELVPSILQKAFVGGF